MMTAAEGDEVNGIDACVTGKVSALVTIDVEPVGKWFRLHWRKHHPRSDTDVLSPQSDEDDEIEEEQTKLEVEDNVTFLRSLDPTEWKDQDHYAVLGIRKLRHKATDDDIKRAYRMKVLRHHPDKRKAIGEEVRQGDDYFTNITRAYEILGNPSKRRAYDSIDPNFDDSVPSVTPENKQKFCQVFGSVFERNSRWSSLGPVPQLGTLDSVREHVEDFYSFWYDFDSWREYSYLDEEEKEKGQDRDERRWIEKQNKTARAKRKKEEMARIRKLVDNAYNCDPRIQRLRDEEKEKKNAQKRAKQEAIKSKQLEEERIRKEAEEALRRQKEEIEAAEKSLREAAKKEREYAKKMLKREQKSLRALSESHSYFATDETRKLLHMADVDKLCRMLDLTQLEALNTKLRDPDSSAHESAFLTYVQDVNERLETEKRELLEKLNRKSDHNSRGNGVGGKTGRPWNAEETQLLIKAVNLFPAGTNQRWEVVSNFLVQHGGGAQRTAKEVLAKAKDLQNSDAAQSALKEEANRKAFDNFEKNQKGATATQTKMENTEATQRFDGPGDSSKTWTSAEQRLLEQALRTYPANTPERWEKIASCVSGRTKKECMQRYKELADIVKAKKAAKDAVSKK